MLTASGSPMKILAMQTRERATLCSGSRCPMAMSVAFESFMEIMAFTSILFFVIYVPTFQYYLHITVQTSGYEVGSISSLFDSSHESARESRLARLLGVRAF